MKNCFLILPRPEIITKHLFLQFDCRLWTPLGKNDRMQIHPYQKIQNFAIISNLMSVVAQRVDLITVCISTCCFFFFLHGSRRHVALATIFFLLPLVCWDAWRPQHTKSFLLCRRYPLFRNLCLFRFLETFFVTHEWASDPLRKAVLKIISFSSYSNNSCWSKHSAFMWLRTVMTLGKGKVPTLKTE